MGTRRAFTRIMTLSMNALRSAPIREPLATPEPQEQRETLEQEVTHTLEEARMVLPGVQALFGFQLIAVYNESFEKLLEVAEQRLHLAAVFLTLVTVVLMMTPAAYHRQADPHHISRGFVKLASRLVAAGMFTLMLSLWLGSYLIARIILKDRLWSLLAVAFLAVLQAGLWFILPRLRARRSHGGAPARQ
jgi:hypothetical protein